MLHNVPGLSKPISNNNIVNLYGEGTLSAANVETVVSPEAAGVEPIFPSDVGEPIVISSSAADVGAVRIVGLGPDFLYQEEIVAVGASSLLHFSRINSLSWLEATAFTGVISATNVGGTATYLTAHPESQLSMAAVYSVAADKKWQVHHVYAGILRDANQAAHALLAIYVRTPGKAFIRPFRFSVTTSGDSTVDYVNSLPTQGDGPLDLYVTAEASHIAVEVVTRISIRLVD